MTYAGNTFSLSDFVGALADPADQAAHRRTLRWVQNATTFGLLSPAGGQVNTGRGVHRRYERREVYKAAVLLALSRLDLPTKQLRMIADFFDGLYAYDRLPPTIALRPGTTGSRRRIGPLRRIWEEAMEGGEAYLAVGLMQDDRFRLGLSASAPPGGAEPIQIVVNLKPVFSGLRLGKGSTGV